MEAQEVRKLTSVYAYAELINLDVPYPPKKKYNNNYLNDPSS